MAKTCERTNNHPSGSTSWLPAVNLAHPFGRGCQGMQGVEDVAANAAPACVWRMDEPIAKGIGQHLHGVGELQVSQLHAPLREQSGRLRRRGRMGVGTHELASSSWSNSATSTATACPRQAAAVEND